MKSVIKMVPVSAVLAAAFSVGAALGAYLVPKDYKTYELTRSITFPNRCETTTRTDSQSGTISDWYIIDNTGTLYFSDFHSDGVTTCEDFQKMWRQK